MTFFVLPNEFKQLSNYLKHNKTQKIIFFRFLLINKKLLVQNKMNNMINRKKLCFNIIETNYEKPQYSK